MRESAPAARYMSSSTLERVNAYVRPAVWLSRCHSRIGSVAGTVLGWAALPPTSTRMSANSGRYFASSSFREHRACSYSDMNATAVTGLVIE